MNLHRPTCSTASRCGALCPIRPAQCTRSRRVQRQVPHFFTIVQQGQEAHRLSLGRNPLRLGPGIALNIPFYHNVQHVDMREGSLEITELEAFTKDNVPVRIGGSLFYQVFDSYKASFGVQNYLASVRNMGTSALRAVIGLFDYDEIISDRNKINAALVHSVGTSSAEWGVRCSKFEIQSFKPSNRDIERQLEMQLEAERSRRRQLLDTEAAVNVAEGQKRQAILESEGYLMSERNRAEGLKCLQVAQSEGALIAAANEADGLRLQLLRVAEALGNDDRMAAAEFLLKLKQIEQLTAIASGQNNAAYFLSPHAATAEQQAAVSCLGNVLSSAMKVEK